MDTAVIEMPVPFVGTFSCRGTPRRIRQLLLGSTPVAIPKVCGSDAPVVLRVDDVRIGGWTEPMAWRDYQGAYWRPLVHDGNRVLRVSAAEFAEANPYLDFRCWNDSPFGWHLAARLFPRVDPSAPYTDPEGAGWGTLREDARRMAYAEARRVGLDGLVEIDGVLHRRAAPPMWSVEPKGWESAEVGAVRLRLPELAWSSWSLGLFPLDQLEAAMTDGTYDHHRRNRLKAPFDIPIPVPGGEGLRGGDYEVAALCMAGFAARRMLDQQFAVPSPETAEADALASEAIHRVGFPACEPSRDALDQAMEAFKVLAGRPDVDRRVGFVRDILTASVGCARSVGFDDEGLTASYMLP